MSAGLTFLGLMALGAAAMWADLLWRGGRHDDGRRSWEPEDEHA
jgi:hypothetical protein